MSKLKKIFCVFFGHSDILDGFMGCMDCARCGERLGDTLASTYSNPRAVIIGHDCSECIANYKKMGWINKVLVPNPFKEDG